MASMVLPTEINYASMPTLPPNTVSSEIVLQPINGATFQPSSMIEIQFPNGEGQYLDPSSLYYRFKIVVTNNGTAASAEGTDYWRGAPAVTAFSRVETYSGSQLLESINEYGVISNDLLSLTMDQSQRYGQQFNLGVSSTVVNDAANGESSCDYYRIGTLGAGGSENRYVAFPVLNCLSQAEKLVPLGRMGNVIMRFTMDTAANVIKRTTANADLTYTITNFELCYTSVKFSQEVEQMLYSSGEKIYLKSCGWASSANSIPATTNGQIELSYPLRYASIKSIFAHFSPSVATQGLNGKFDSVALQNTAFGTGQARYQFTIGGVPYPQRELDTLYNPAGIMCELRKAVGGLTSKTNSMSINTVEFVSREGGTTTASQPARHIVGVNCEMLPSASNALLTGVSSSSSNITFRTLCNVTSLVTVLLYVNYDLLLEIDPTNRSVIAKF